MDPRENFHFACAQTEKLLKSAKPPTQCTTVLREIHKRFETLREAVVETEHVELACKAGCAFCCHLRVDAYAHEVLYAADFIRRNLPVAQMDAIVAKSKAHAKKIGAMTLAQQTSSINACPVLVEGRCSAYGGRPMSCRSYHSLDVSSCQRVFETCDANALTTVSAPLYWNTRAVLLGVAKAFEKEGYDDAVYDFGIAIGEALENPVTARRWRDKKRAFSIHALAKDQLASAASEALNRRASW